MNSKIFYLIIICGTLFAGSGCKEDEPYIRSEEEAAAIAELRSQGNLVIDFFAEGAKLRRPVDKKNITILHTLPYEGGSVTIDYQYHGEVTEWMSYHLGLTENGFISRKFSDYDGDEPRVYAIQHPAIYKIDGIWVEKPYLYECDFYTIDATHSDCITISMPENQSEFDRVIVIDVGIGYLDGPLRVGWYPFPIYDAKMGFQYEQFNSVVVQQAGKGREAFPGLLEHLRETEHYPNRFYGHCFPHP